MVSLVQELFEQVLRSIFLIKGITYENIEIYAWKDGQKFTVQTLEDLTKIDNFITTFCLSNTKLRINDIPFKFDWFDFSCSCINGKYCGLQFDPDNFGFNSVVKLSDGQITELKDEMMGNLRLIAQSLFSLSGN